MTSKPNASSLIANTAPAIARPGPDNPCTQASRLAARGRLDDARHLLEQAATNFPSDPAVHEALGLVLLQDGRLDQAASALGRAIALEPSRATAHTSLSDVFAARGHRPEAEQALRTAVRFDPGSGQAWLRLAHLRRFRKKEDPDFRKLRQLVRNRASSPSDQEALSFALAKAYDDLGCPNDAFRYMQAANELHRQRHPFDVNAMHQLMTRMAAVCDPAFFERCRSFGSDSSLPVFLVGLPRSGSSLVEQIIASHPNAQGVGELGTLPRLAADLPDRLGTRTPFPECLRELREDVARSLASDYLRRLTRDATADTLRVCDKMLSNVVLVGLIAVLFPHARVLHCKRSLMDTGLSMYQQSFQGGGVGYAYDLEDIGKVHRMTHELLTHWHRASPVRVFEVEYEALVREPEPRSRAVIDAIGLPWNAACLSFHRRQGATQTVSNWQVRQPVHTRSVERWRPYAKHLAALRKYAE